nr:MULTISPECIES: transposase [unclassified Streptomyces]
MTPITCTCWCTTRRRPPRPGWSAPLKGACARRLRQESPGHNHKYLWGDHFWSPSYSAASCGGAPLSIIKEYVDNQRRPG